MNQPLQVLLAERAEGKTTQAMAWVSNGERCDTYPGWTRVVVVPTMRTMEYVRAAYWNRLDDFDHRVYVYLELMDRPHRWPDTEICIDELNLLMQPFEKLPGRVTRVTMTGVPWEKEVFRPRPEYLEK